MRPLTWVLKDVGPVCSVHTLKPANSLRKHWVVKILYCMVALIFVAFMWRRAINNKKHHLSYFFIDYFTGPYHDYNNKYGWIFNCAHIIDYIIFFLCEAGQLNS